MVGPKKNHENLHSENRAAVSVSIRNLPQKKTSRVNRWRRSAHFVMVTPGARTQ